ncbi:unnamed protein product [Meloidogyne enterolobii]|uniref:Uncharacterized protein n=1 Tax=Meloidogyne enterolobii TaxID=390850 RepID=A0ACB1A3B1_MELEN
MFCLFLRCLVCFDVLLVFLVTTMMRPTREGGIQQYPHQQFEHPEHFVHRRVCLVYECFRLNNENIKQKQTSATP